MAGEIRFELRSHDLLTIRKAPLLNVKCIRGSLWVTQTNDTRDYVLHAGEGFRFQTTRCGYVLALTQAQVLVLPNESDKQANAVNDLYDKLARVARALVGRL